MLQKNQPEFPHLPLSACPLMFIHPSSFIIFISPLPPMKKLHQPHFPILPCFTLPTAIFTPVAPPQISRKTGCSFTIFQKPRDLEFVRK